MSYKLPISIVGVGSSVSVIHINNCHRSKIQLSLLSVQLSVTGIVHDVRFDEHGYNSHIVYDISRIEPVTKDATRGRPKLVGTWSRKSGLVVPPGAIFKNHFTHFENQVLRIAMIEVGSMFVCVMCPCVCVWSTCGEFHGLFIRLLDQFFILCLLDYSATEI